MKTSLDIWLRFGHWIFLILFAGVLSIALILPNTQQWAAGVLVGLPGLFLLISGLTPFFPNYKCIQYTDYTPMVSYMLRVILGISIILAAAAMHFGREAKLLILIGSVICCVILISVGIRWMLKKRLF